MMLEELVHQATILIVEDDIAIATLERRRLERAGYTVDHASTAAEALRRIGEGDVDLLVLDYHLPGGVTGLMFYEQLKTAGYNLPVIIVTGDSNETTVIKALRLGVHDFVTKSLSYLDYLPGAVSSVLMQVRAERRLEESERRFRALVQHSSDGIIVLDQTGKVSYASPAVERIAGHTPTDLLGIDSFSLIHPEDLSPAKLLFETVLATPGATMLSEMRLRHRDQTWCHIEATSTNLLTEPGISGVVINFHDISERKVLEAQLTHQAFHDPLTGLPNRALFMDRVDHAVARATRHGGSLAVLFLDLDRFKAVNDGHGHTVGDALLNAVADRLRHCVREGDTIARLGGDEFTLLLEYLVDNNEAVRVAMRIAEELAKDFILDGRTISITASVGIALSTHDHASTVTLLRDADVAMYRAKHGGKARYMIFDPLIDAAAQEQLALEADLRRALGVGKCAEFRLYYQPIVDLATGKLTGMEALVRWEHTRRGLLSPATFIPLAEQTGLLIPLGRWVLAEACRQVCIWQARFSAETLPSISVNLSPRQFIQPNLVADVAQILAETSLAPGSLTLEITETVLMANAAETLATLGALRALGVRLAIDDFGTGYSSLAYLTRFPVDVLKIDRSFVTDLTPGTADAAIIGAVAGLGRTLGLAVVAEGVETAAQATQLAALGCAMGQGYHFAPPRPAETIGTLLQNNSRFLA
jgi:diguanylate cyclase (GGDEF)-like protein/PAS domain S-box-containing protein